MEAARAPCRRGQAVIACLLASMSFVSLRAEACRTDPPIRVPPLAELTQSSDLIAIVHVDRIQPMTAEEEAFTKRIYTDPPLNVPIRLPSPSAVFTVIRPLKGTFPAAAPLRRGADSCEVVLMEGRDYLVFARLPLDPKAEIVPLHGTFLVDQSQYSLDSLAEVQSTLDSPNPTRP